MDLRAGIREERVLALDTASSLLIRAFVPTFSGINLFMFAADSFIFSPHFLIMTDLTR